ncbi:MAG: FimB/Mfa2 family fimbrial subunit [Bacteroidales bacterium]|nr:FimB/Mfa2 family fimbrial subunit [Bacteroidales bacterium]
MKTNNIILAVASAVIMTFSFTCCTNPEVEVRNSIEIKLCPSTILSGLTPYNSSDFKMDTYDDETCHLRISCLLYDEAGKLAYRQEALLDDYNSDVSFTAMLDAGSYRLIALATNIFGTLSSPTLEAYSITGAEQLNQLQIHQNNEESYYSTWSIMGYATYNVSDFEKDVVVNMEPATSLVYLQWKNIHAHDNDVTTSDIYGQYTATATDYWGQNTFTWSISIEKDGSSTTDVIVKDFSPALYNAEFTAEKGYNTYKGKISGNTLTIQKGQSTGCKDEDGDVLLEGGTANGSYITLEDIVLKIGDGKLTTANMFGTCVPESDNGWYDLFSPGVVFSKALSSGIDKYYIIYHLNDIMKFSDSGTPQYSSSLSSVSNEGSSVSPANNPSATNIYEMCNLFPGSINIFARTFVGNNQTDYSKQSISLKSGHQYVFSLDCNSIKLNASESVLGSKAVSANEFVASNAYRFHQIPFDYIPQKHFKH